MKIIGPGGVIQSAFAKQFSVTNTDTGKIVHVKARGAGVSSLELTDTTLDAADYGSPTIQLWNDDKDQMTTITAVGNPISTLQVS